MSRIKILTTPSLVVNSAGTGFDAPTDSTNFPADSSTNGVITPVVDGEILKVVINYNSSDANAVLTIGTRDTPSENIINTTDWTSDETIYPLLEGLDNTGASIAASNKTNVFVKYTVRGSLLIDCSSATDNDTVQIMIYYR